jgi:hypothetical protein
LDKAEWQAIERQGKRAIQDWIDRQMKGTSVAVVLIGQETSGREWVQYEIKRGYEDGKGLLGIYIHNLKDRSGKTDIKGANPFSALYVEQNGVRTYLSSLYKTYDWVNDGGITTCPAGLKARRARPIGKPCHFGQ